MMEQILLGFVCIIFFGIAYYKFCVKYAKKIVECFELEKYIFPRKEVT